jgi:hypothetical protein
VTTSGHQIGGVAVVVEGDCPGLTSPAALQSPETLIRLTSEPSDQLLRPDETPVIEQDSWAAFVDGDTFRLCIVDGGETAARIDLPRNGLDGRLVYRAGVAPPLFGYPADQLLLIHALGVCGGALIHGAALVGRDGGYLVSGPSGTGKTTISREWHALGGRVLSDERTVVRPAVSHNGWVLGGTPWPGEGGFADNAVVPLRGLMLLEQADHDELVAITPARALALLYRCHFPPLWDAQAGERTIANLERLVRAVPAFRLHNRRGPAAARMLLERLGG